MDSAKWQAIKKTFSMVVDLQPESRFEILAKEPDKKNRREVENLLKAHESVENFIEKPCLIEQQIVEDETVDALIGKKIKDYLILERIGTGGLGTVYLTEKTDLGLR